MWYKWRGDRNSELIADDPFSASIHEASITYSRLHIARPVTIAIISEIKLSSTSFSFLSFFFFPFFLIIFARGNDGSFFHRYIRVDDRIMDFYANTFPVVDD